MPEKGVSFSPILQWRFHLLTALVLVLMVIVWTIDGCSVNNFIQSWRLKHELLVKKLPSQPTNLTQQHQQQQQHKTHQDLTVGNISITSLGLDSNFTNTNRTKQTPTLAKENNFTNLNSTTQTPKLGKDTNFSSTIPLDSVSGADSSEWLLQEPGLVRWVSTELGKNVTKNLIARWLTPGGETCKDSKTAEIVIPGLDGEDLIELTAGESHEIGFQAVDESRNPRCQGGDYFETDLSGEAWKGRPAIKDFGNGSYSISLQVHPDFAGDYTLTVILLFRHFEGLKFSPSHFAVNKELRRVRIRFVKGNARLPPLQTCGKSDFSRDLWSGRWTRHGKNDSCEISYDGRYRCLAPEFPCQSPWCNGSLGSLESNGWVYSAHCSFRLYSADAAWNCLNNRWIFFWGDSNHVDTIRNMLNFVLGLPEIKAVPRRFDMNFTNPKDPSQSVRITSIFNGHWNETMNYQGLNSLQDEGFRNLLKKYFSEKIVPDTIIMNSGLHDGIYWSTLRKFAKGADFAASFWKEVMDSVKQRGLKVPQIFYRTTVATGGYARSLGFNPYKMEAFNWVVLDKFRSAGLVSGVIDNFDMTFPWHFDNRCNDGVHYGRAPAKRKWRDGEIGHQYFVDIMLAHVLLNALCAR